MFNLFKNIKLNLFKYDPYMYAYPKIVCYSLNDFVYNYNKNLKMVLDLLIEFHNNKDNSLVFRRSCREGICGSCAMNINGINSLACIHKFSLMKKIDILPLPHIPVIKDLIVSLDNFFEQYKLIDPYLKQYNSKIFDLNYELYLISPNKENIQLKKERNLLNGLYECILCACCSSSCPSYWWNRDIYLGPAILLQIYRWLIDSRDDSFIDRLFTLSDHYKINRCHLILNCTEVCPKGLNPASSISSIQLLLKL